MASTFSPNKNYELQATGENQDTWGILLDAVLSQVDLNMGGRLAVSITSANVTLTSGQAENVYLSLSGTLTGNRDLIFPATAGSFYIINNGTAGAFTVTAKPSGGSGVALPTGTSLVFINPTATTAYVIGPALNAANAWTAAQTITLSSAGATPLALVSTDADAAAGPILELYRNSASPLASDQIGQVASYGKDSATNKQLYGSITNRIDDPTSGSEDSTWLFNTLVAGSGETHWNIGNGVSTRGLTPQGSGSINAGSYYDDGTRIGGAVVASFSAHKNGTGQSVTTGDIITFGTELFDVGSFFASNAWTPPAGTATISCAVEAGLTNDQVAGFQLFKNGSLFQNGALQTFTPDGAGTVNVVISTAWIFQCNGTDVFTVRWFGSSVTITGTSTDTWISGAML